MKKELNHLLVIILLFNLVQVFGQENVKLISYNIWNGFDWGKDKAREEKLISWMESKAPDMVALQELCGYNEQRLKDQAQAWGHEYSVLLKTSGYSVGLTSRFPIEVKEKIMKGMHHGALHCSSNGFEIFVIHLSPFRWEKRNEEAEILKPRIEKEIQNGKKVIVCGDYNAFSPIDEAWYKSRNQLLEDKRMQDEKNKKIENLREGYFDHSTLSKFYAMGLYDSVTKFMSQGLDRISYPTQIFADKESSQQRMIDKGIRIDYILTSYNLVDQLVDLKIYNGPEAYYLSDHYPVEATFYLKDQ